MIKVFLAEDEFIIREGIKKNIDWSGNGFEFCGEASDGELALPMIRKLNPDIVITDIKMPFMDGIELSRLIKKEFPNIEIIILSGYEEFEYAKEGIKLGVAQYLTKPITGDELLKEVKFVADKIQSKKQEKDLREQFLKEMEENVRSDRRELFQKLVSGSYSATDMLDMAGELEIDLSAMWYSVALLWMKSINHNVDEYSKSRVSISDKLDEIVDSGECLLFDRNLDDKAFIFTADTQEELLAKQNRILDLVEEALKCNDHIRYFGGIGKPVNRLSNLHITYEDAGYALAHRYFVSDNMFLKGEVAQVAIPADNDDFSVRDVDAKNIDSRNLTKFLKTGSKEEVAFFLNDFIKSVGENAIKSNLFRQYITMDAYFAVKNFVGEISSAKDSDIPAVETVDFSSEESAKAYLLKILDGAIAIRESVAVGRYSEIVEDAIRYIEDNYCDDELSLNMLASHVNVSPNHLSAIFSQQTGQTFIKFLTEYRMEKAKELLKCTGKRSSEISEDVGYKDPHYFSYMFKKSVGMTPTQYRGGKESEEE